MEWKPTVKTCNICGEMVDRGCEDESRGIKFRCFDCDAKEAQKKHAEKFNEGPNVISYWNYNQKIGIVVREGEKATQVLELHYCDARNLALEILKHYDEFSGEKGFEPILKKFAVV